MPARDRRLLLGLAATCALVALLHGSVGLDVGLMYLAPALLLLLPLCAGRYLGEGRLIRAVTRARRDPLMSATVRSARTSCNAVPRGGALMAAGLAVRPPPVQSLV